MIAIPSDNIQQQWGVEQRPCDDNNSSNNYQQLASLIKIPISLLVLAKRKQSSFLE